ncbi:MAG TPA: glycosyltransferase [Casimicrobiaceae bacterium]|nr:glycosyltransferase [Casimicrobiaceae bacterium]
MSLAPIDPPPGHERTPTIAAAIAEADAAWSAGDRPRAMSLLRALAERAPTSAAVWSRLGACALEAGQTDAAHAYLRNALAQAGDDSLAWTNLGTALTRLARVDEGVAAYRRALELDPAAVGARINLANALGQRGDVDGAVAELETARSIAPDAHEILNNLGNLYKDQGRFDDAFAAYEAARRAWPDFRVAFSNLLALTKLSTRHAPDEIFALHRAFAERFEPEWEAGYVPPGNVADPDRRLRLCYVSPDCHTALPSFVEPVLRRHDRTRFDVFAYFNNPQPAATLARIAPITSRIMRGATDEEVAQWVRADGIDILVDIAGHTGHNRLGVFGRKPAPVQITWLDYLNTTGLAAIDWRLTDAVADPPGASDALHSESLLRVAPAQWCWNPPGAALPLSGLPALRAGHLTLGSFNACSKLTDATLALWQRVLAAVPQSRLVVVGVPAGAATSRIEAALGVRVRVLSRLAPEAFRDAVAGTDIALDPLPFSGATTTLEALWQGVPVVTRSGATSASRSSASILSALGIGEWIAEDEDGYIAIVDRAARSLDALAALRSRLPSLVQRSALCDAARFTAALEQMLRDAWRSWCVRSRGVSAPSSSTAPGVAKSLADARSARRFAADARLALLDAALREGRGAEVVADACELVDDEPHWKAAHRAYLQALLAWTRTQPRLVERVFPSPPPFARRPKVSALVCSIDRARFDSVTASYRARFAGFELELVGVHDARSLAEGYNRAAGRASGDILVFSHDDIELVTSDFAARLIAHLERYDGVGVAGASRVAGPRWGDAGPRAIHGHILHAPPRGQRGALLMAAGFQRPVCEDIRLLDGVFIAVRRHVWESTRFDPDRYDGFHLYDLDFTSRASAAGARLAVPADLVVFHASQGRYGEAWRRYARRFAEAAGLDWMAPAPLAGLQARVETRDQVDRLRAAMVHFRYGAPASAREGGAAPATNPPIAPEAS